MSKNMSFGEALVFLRAGDKVAREGWNGKGMWVSRTEGKILDLDKDNTWTKNVRDVAVSNGGFVELLPYLSMKTADGKIQIGWLASQSDMLAFDWCVVD